MKWIKAIEPAKGNHADTLIVRFKGKKRLIENRYGEYWVWQTDREKEIRVYDNQWAELEYLDESPPASAEKEAARLYPDEATGMQFMTTTNEIATYQRSAHITCAGMYVDTIDNLKNDVAKLEAENKALIEEIQNWKDELKDQAREYRNNR